MNPNSAQMAVRFAPPRPGSRSRPDSSLRRRVRELRAEAAAALGVGATAVVAEHPDLEFSERAMSGLAQQCVARAESMALVDDAAARPLYLLALDLQQLALDLQQEEVAARTARLGDCAEGLARLRTVSTSEDLIAAACHEIVSRCEFGRAVVSRVERDTWAPTVAHFADGDGSWFSEWVGAQIPMDAATPERRMLVERRPALVADTAQTAVHRPIIVESGHSTSYVVAPIVSGQQVVGLVHADHFPDDRQVGDADREVLGAFAEGFTRLLERMSLIESLATQRARVDEAVTGVLDELGRRDLEPSSLLRLGVPVQIQDVGQMTPREAEVLRLMVTGHSNPVIAELLGISLDTVKSHVKQILRKLGVSNRAQAIARAVGTAPLL